MNKKVELTSSVSLGNLLQIAAMLVALAGVYWKLEARSAANALALTKTVTEIEDIEQRTRTLETQQARSDERLGNIHVLLARIDGRLERIERGRSLP